MKLITAIVQPPKLDEVRAALDEIDLSGMTVTEVKGFGRQAGHKEIYRGSEYSVEFTPKFKVELLVADEQVQECIDVLLKSANTGKAGAGKIFVRNLSYLQRIRTGETGTAAI